MRKKQSIAELKKEIEEIKEKVRGAVLYLELMRRADYDVFRAMARSDQIDKHVAQPLKEAIRWDDKAEELQEQTKELTDEIRKTTANVTFRERFHAATTAIANFFRRKKKS